MLFVTICNYFEAPARFPSAEEDRFMADTEHNNQINLAPERPPHGGKRLAKRDLSPAALLARLRALLARLLHRIRRIIPRARTIRSEQREGRFPESNRSPVQLVLLLAGLLPMWSSRIRERIFRRRGAQIYGAMFRENPNLKALFYWILCFNTEYLTSPDPVAMARQNGDLQPAFFDGILDAMPETARLINGDEHTYRAEAVKRDFAYSLCNQRTVCPKLISPENRAKFLRLTQVSFAIYSDMYANDENAFWYFPPKGGSRAEHLRRNLLDATRLADEYIWFWGEKHPTIHWENAYVEPRVRCPDTWDEAIPGMTEALLCCKDVVRELYEGLLECAKAFPKDYVDGCPFTYDVVYKEMKSEIIENYLKEA